MDQGKLAETGRLSLSIRYGKERMI